jgi:phosphoglycolate phosphatase-like HAD superfamily hydrolase
MNSRERLRDVRGVVKDFDDTSTNTIGRIQELLDEFASQLGAPPPGMDGLLRFWGEPLGSILAGLFPHHAHQTSTEQLTQQYLASVPSEWEPYPLPDLEQIAMRLQLLGMVQGIASIESEVKIRQFLLKHHPTLIDTYAFIYGRETGGNDKIDPQFFKPVLAALHTQGVNKNQWVYVGDQVKDYLGAVAAGGLFIGVAGNERTRQRFLEAGVENDLLLPSLNKLPDLLESFR